MSYTFCVYNETGEVHILDSIGTALCGKIKINKYNCEEIGIYINKTKFKPFKNLSEDEAIAVAHSLQVLSGINICANCVRTLYRNK